MAFVLDGAALAAIGFVLLALLSVPLGPTVRIEFDGAEAPRLEIIAWRVVLNAIALADLSAAYFVGSWTRGMRSPGQALLGIGVADAADGATRLPMGRAMLRWALLGAPLGIAAAASVNAPLAFLLVTAASVAWFAILLLTAVFSRTGRGIHDRLAASVVVHRQ